MDGGIRLVAVTSVGEADQPVDTQRIRESLNVNVIRDSRIEGSNFVWGKYIACSAVAITLCTTVSCRKNSSDLIAELKTREMGEGLALIRTYSNWFMIVSFEKGAYSVRNPRGLASAWIAEGGDLVAWNIPAYPVPRACDGATTIETLTGKLLRQVPGKILYLQTMAVSADGLRVAFDGTYIPKMAGPSAHAALQTPAGIHYLNVQTGSLSTVSSESNQSQDSISWSPAGGAFTYADAGRIHILDVSTGASRSIGSGHNPTWSPDGHWIAFRSTDGWATAVNPASLQSNRLLPDSKILGAVHWSPDSRYVLVSEPISIISNILQWRSPIGGPIAELVVYRLRDGARASVSLLPPGGVSDDLGFEWVKNLRGFMEGASPPPMRPCQQR